MSSATMQGENVNCCDVTFKVMDKENDAEEPATI